MVKIPQYLSRLPKFLKWELDELIVFILPLLLYVMFGFSFMLMTALSIGLTFLYHKQKETMPRGLIFHTTYMLGLAKFDGFESVHCRSYSE